MHSKIGLGTAAIGRPQYINIRQERIGNLSLEEFRKNGRNLLDTAYQLGVRYFDTAPGYGLAEQLLLDWIQSKNEVEIATKWGYTYTAGFDPNAKVHEVKEHSLSKLNEQWEQSKGLLPQLTTYQIHSATFESGVLDNILVLNRLAELKEENKLIIGLSTTGANQVEILKKAFDIEINGRLLFDTFQVTYNIFDQSIAELSDSFKQHNKRLIIKEALANGRIFPNKRYPHYRPILQKLKELTRKYKVGIDAIALRFCIDSIPSFKVLSGASLQKHLSDNLKAEQFELLESELNVLKRLAINPKIYWHERKQLRWN